MKSSAKTLNPEVQKKLDAMAVRWAKVIDNARYLGVEHKHKEKEYGIKWRSAFKIELEKEADKIIMKFGNPMEQDPTWNGGLLEVILALVEKDFKDVQAFTMAKQYDLLEMLLGNLEFYEGTCGYLRSILKNPDLHMDLEKEHSKG